MDLPTSFTEGSTALLELARYLLFLIDVLLHTKALLVGKPQDLAKRVTLEFPLLPLLVSLGKGQLLNRGLLQALQAQVLLHQVSLIVVLVALNSLAKAIMETLGST